MNRYSDKSFSPPVQLYSVPRLVSIGTRVNSARVILRAKKTGGVYSARVDSEMIVYSGVNVVKSIKESE